jgi:hypothetical protein
MRNRGITALLLIVIVTGSISYAQARTASSSGKVCQTTASTNTEKPTNTNTASFSSHWYRSADKRIWASAPARWFAGDHKVLWERPLGTQLKVTAKRLDGDAPPFKATLPDGYQSFDYQASGLNFPSAGCWEVTAQADQSQLQFTLDVLPRSYQPGSGACGDLSEAVKSSGLILAGKVVSSAPDRHGFIWQTIEVVAQFKGPRIEQNLLDMLHDSMLEAKIKPGTEYLFFLVSQPGYPWRMLCSYLPLVAVSESDGQLSGPVWDQKIGTLAELKAQISKLLAE